MSDKIQKDKRDLFCCYFAVLGNPEEAAVRSGFSRENALRNAADLLKQNSVRKEIKRYRECLADSGSIVTGLKRLAFGNCSDAVYLVFADELPPPDVISSLDLFGVSEIKRVKGGGVEIKFFDRIKALEKLFELENAFSDRSKAADLIDALSSSAEECDVIDDK